MGRIKLKILGGFEAAVDEETPLKFDTDIDRALFVYLVAAANRPLRRGSLVGLFWPEKTEAHARHSLCQAIHSLRKQLHSQPVSDPFEVTPQTILFRLQDPSGMDYYEFDQILFACEQHCVNLDITCQACLERLERAAELYHGDYCAGLTIKKCETFEEWLCLQRETYRLKYVRILDLLVNGLCSIGDIDKALAYAYHKIFLDPYDETGQRKVIQLLMKLGRRKKAIEQYEVLRHLLATELNIPPAKETIDLYEQLLYQP